MDETRYCDWDLTDEQEAQVEAEYDRTPEV